MAAHRGAAAVVNEEGGNASFEGWARLCVMGGPFASYVGGAKTEGSGVTAKTCEPSTMEGDGLLEGFLELRAPAGFRAELIEGEIAVMPLLDGDHEDIIGLIVEQVFAHSATRMNFAGNKGLILPGEGSRTPSHVVPDATFAPAEARLFRGAPPWMPCQGVAMVVEVTSTRPERDRDAKRRAYARGGVPLYLLVDRDEATVRLFKDPEKGEYRTIRLSPFGKAVELPEPFSCTLETAEFL